MPISPNTPKRNHLARNGRVWAFLIVSPMPGLDESFPLGQHASEACQEGMKISLRQSCTMSGSNRLSFRSPNVNCKALTCQQKVVKYTFARLGFSYTAVIIHLANIS